MFLVILFLFRVHRKGGWRCFFSRRLFMRYPTVARVMEQFRETSVLPFSLIIMNNFVDWRLQCI